MFDDYYAVGFARQLFIFLYFRLRGMSCRLFTPLVYTPAHAD